MKREKDTFVKLKEGTVFRIMENESALVRPDDGTLIILNETGTFIVKNIKKKISKKALIRKIINEYDTTLQRVEKDVDSFLKKLEKEGIIEIS
ncbi:MAG: PqqD family protein [Deltaproteobacteria bacterium]|nr:PqqD family protein [Deltaproteobacteria bacterium]